MDLESGKVMSFLFGKRENEGRGEKVGEEWKFVGMSEEAAIWVLGTAALEGLPSLIHFLLISKPSYNERTL